MNEFKKSPENYSAFYTNENLGLDLKLVEKGYYQFRKYFRGNIALELGPANGYMTKLLKNDFEQLMIVDGSSTLLSQIPDFKNVVKCHSLFENYRPSYKFDTIIMNHVLEHIEDPIILLKRIYGWLKSNGVFILGVPNAKSFHRLAAVKMGLLKNEYELNKRDISLGHYRVYDLDLLKKHVSTAGFNIIHEGGVFIKFLSNKQTEGILTDEIIDAYFQLGEDFYYNSAEIYLVLNK